MTDDASVLSMLQFLFSKVKKERFLLIISALFLLGISFVEFKIPQITQKIIDVDIPAQSFQGLWFSILKLLSFAIILSFLSYYSTMIMSRTSQNMIITLRGDLYDHLLNQDFAYFEHAKTGDLMTRLTSDVRSLQDLISAQSLKLISNIITFIFIYGFMLYQDATLTLLITITFPLLFLLNRFFSQRIKQAFRKVRASTAEINNHLQNSLTSVLLIKTFVTEPKEIAQFDGLNEKNKKDYLEAMTYQAVFSPSIELVNYLGMAIVLVYSGYAIINNEQTLGSLVAYLAYLRMLQNPIRSFTQMISRFQQAAVSYGRIIDVYHSVPKVVSHEASVPLTRFEQGITFDAVSFGYQLNTSVLKEVSFTINKGELTALVGVSGSGKTTVTKLIERLYDATSGTITIDGRNIKDLTLTSLRQTIGMVTQDIELIDGTIYENIVYGSENKSTAEVTEAIRAAKLAEFVAALPDGLDTEVGERGIKLSGGQKQRIAIGRIFLKNAPILILDEATASLDNESERFIQESLDSLMNDRTSLVIAHRLSTIQKADQIIVMEQGEVLERGTHAELLARAGRYRVLYDAQFS